MYCVKGSWAGQTLALAIASDSGGRKSRIRRSKEERKTMVESFIKRYESLNNGNFPSLNLTHKEVGGSFYTVREIVREIIQENRVLGPGQFTSEEQKDDVLGINYLLGTISSEPQGPLHQTVNKANDFSTQEVKETVLLNLDANGKYTEHIELDVVQYPTEHQADVVGEANADEMPSISKSENLNSFEQEKEKFELGVSLNSSGKCSNVIDTDAAHVVIHIDTNEISENFNKLLVEGSRESETFEVDRQSEQMGAFQAKVTLPTEEVEVETFPLRPAVKESDDSSSTSTDSKNFDANFNDFEVKKVTLSNNTQTVDKVSSFDTPSNMVTSKAANSFDFLVSGGIPDMIIKDAEVDHVVVQNREVNQENLPFKDDIAILYNRMNHISAHGDSTSTTTQQDKIQPRNASTGTTYLENNSGISCKKSKEPTLVNEKGFKKNENAVVGSSPLDRIDLESWKASKEENNPLIAFFKAFIGAFSRLWS